MIPLLTIVIVELGEFYDTDINEEDLSTDFCDCRMLLNSRGDISPKTPIELLSFIISYGDYVFTNLRIALQYCLQLLYLSPVARTLFQQIKANFVLLAFVDGTRSL